jgi:beta-1,2-mannobiose phosphorylase / 1,2-beta-oligomannan phosphorylase
MKFKLERYPNNTNPKPILVPRKEIGWEAKAVFNPSVVYDEGVFKMLYRTYPDIFEPKAPRLNRPGFYFKNQISHIGYAESKDGINFDRREKSFISPSEDYDKYGCEDPRITKIGDTFYITYTAIDTPLHDKDPNTKIRIALATTKDFVTVEKHGIIGPPKQSKAAAFFPENVNGGKVGLIMTISPDSTNSHVVIRYYDSIDEVMNQTDDSWTKFLETSQNEAILQTKWWLHRGPELGAPPVKTDHGWLLIFSNESMSDSWTIGAALLDLNNPNKLITRTPGYILQPKTDYERKGIVPNVTFPEGVLIVGDELYVYYGSADTVIGLATCKLKDLFDYILSFRGK